jgi:dTDP-glucose 4,6-dehydratase
VRAIVTGGAGFIGSALVLRLLQDRDAHVLTIDKLTYAGNLASLAPAMADPRHQFLQADICDADAMAAAFDSFKPDIVFNLAAESHVDRSILGAGDFVRTNVMGVAVLLQAAQTYLDALPAETQQAFRFVHISTDEVFGALGEQGAFSEASPYAPNSPYSASKAGGDHLVRAWRQTYGLPALITNCSNNYGPRQFPEKLIPLMILAALQGNSLPVYGEGKNVRDWIHVDDHVDGILAAADHGELGERYLFGGGCERRNIDLVRGLCAELERMRPCPNHGGYQAQIKFVTDRKGHDFRYAIDDADTRRRLGWAPQHDLESGLRSTIAWYLDNEAWWAPLLPKAALRHPT